MTRKECLNAAIDAVCKDRENTYGPPEDNFKLIADLWSTYTGVKISPRDAAVMMILLKTARARTGTNHSDNFVDMAGYAACAAEIMEPEKQGKPKFKLEDYPKNYVMHCDTEEKAKIFCDFLDNEGRIWFPEAVYNGETRWENYKKDTVYYFNDGAYAAYANKECAEDEGYTILEFDDFDFDWE